MTTQALSPSPLAAVPAIRLRKATFDGSRTWVMGVLNVTPDSFSDGGMFVRPEDALRRAEQMVEEGAHLIDIGGESTRPGAEPIDAAVEWARLSPVLAAIARLPVPISVDTYKADIAERALAAGADLVNDVSGGLLDPRIASVCGRAGAPMILSHLRGTPKTMQADVAFTDVFEEVARELGERVSRANAAGVEQVVVDPGLGFGKHVQHNVTLLARCAHLSVRLGAPVLVGPSRKGFLGTLTGLPLEQRGPATLAAVVTAACRGARFVRVHDVAAARQALTVADAALRAVGERSAREAPTGAGGEGPS